MATSMLSRFQGSLVGGVLGDCIGAIYEGAWLPGIAIGKVVRSVQKVEAVGNAKGHKDIDDTGPEEQKKARKLWNYTDDTAMARSVAASLIKNNKLDVKDLAKMFSEEYFKESNRGYGGGVVTVFCELAKMEYLDPFHPAKEQFNGQGSYGNGGAMRIAPAALFAQNKSYNFTELKDLVENITCITHTHKQAILGAVLECAAVHLALNTVKLDVNSFIDALIKQIKPFEESTSPDKKKEEKEGSVRGSEQTTQASASDDKDEIQTYWEKLEKIRVYSLQEVIPDTKDIVTVLGTDISAFRSVPAAIYSFLRATQSVPELQDRHPFERTIIYAISLGGDTDTIATMAGAIAGAYYGIEPVPYSWQASCEGVDEAMQMAQNLYDLK